MYLTAADVSVKVKSTGAVSTVTRLPKLLQASHRRLFSYWILYRQSIMKASCKVAYQISTVSIFLFSLFVNSLTPQTFSSNTRRFVLKSCLNKQQPASLAPRLLTSFRSISGYMMRRSSSTSTSQQATPLGGGAYQEVPQKVLLQGVEDKPVFLKRPEQLRNKYYGLRHGSKIHGLTVSGRVQARRAAGILIETVKRENLKNLVFLSSNFTRARETAEETLKAMQSIIDFEEQPFRTYTEGSYVTDNTEATSRTAKTTVSTIISDIHLPEIAGNRINVIVNNNLRERYFGELDGLDLIYYNKVWPIDSVDSENVRDGIESVSQVVARAARLIDELESTYSGKSIVLTSHADTLQIMQTFLSFEDPRKFSQYRFKNGEVRDMEALPSPVPMIYRGFFK